MLDPSLHHISHIEESFTRTVISVPARKSWRLSVFIFIWLFSWIIGMVVLTGQLSGRIQLDSAGPDWALISFMTIWTIGGVLALITFSWTVIGKEVMTVENGLMKIERKGALFYKPKFYDLRQVQNLRSVKESYTSATYRGSKQVMPGPYSDIGTIQFGYDGQTVKFGQALDEAEGNYIINLLRKKNLLR